MLSVFCCICNEPEQTLGRGLWPCKTLSNTVIYCWPFQGDGSVVAFSNCLYFHPLSVCHCLFVILFRIAWWPVLVAICWERAVLLAFCFCCFILCSLDCVGFFPVWAMSWDMALFVLRTLILQTRMHSHPVGLNVWFFVGPFVYFHTSYVRKANALARLSGRRGSPEPSLVAYVMSTISHELAYLVSRVGCGSRLNRLLIIANTLDLFLLNQPPLGTGGHDIVYHELKIAVEGRKNKDSLRR